MDALAWKVDFCALMLASAKIAKITKILNPMRTMMKKFTKITITMMRMKIQILTFSFYHFDFSFHIGLWNK